MTSRIVTADLEHRARSFPTLLALLAVVALTALAVRLDIVQAGFASGRSLRNSPLALYRLGVLVTQMGAFLFGPLAAALLLRDRERGRYGLLFACPITPGGYFWGRFVGGCATLGALALGMVAGVILGCALPGVDPDSVGVHAFLPWLMVLGLVVFPNLLVVSGLTFAACAATTRAAMAFVVPLVLFVFDLAMVTVADRNGSAWVALLEPMASVAGALATQGWTVAEQNGLRVPVTPVLLANRLLWMGLAGAAMAVAASRFRFDDYFRGGRGRRSLDGAPFQASGWKAEGGEPAPPRERWLRTLVALGLSELRLILRRPETFLLAGAALFFLHVDQAFGHSVMGAPLVPTAARLARFEPLSYGLFARAALVVFSGFLVARWRRDGFHELAAATPAPTWLPMASRFLAAATVAAVLALLAIPTGLLVQLGTGGIEPDLGLYLQQVLLVEYPGLLAFLGLAFLAYALVPGHWTAGAAALAGAWTLVLALPRLGLEHPLVIFGAGPSYVHTDFNGYGPFVLGIAALHVYWLAVGALLALVGYLGWPRGTDTSLWSRLAALRRRLSAGWTTCAAAAVMVAVLAGVAVAHGSGELGTVAARERAAVLYEREYSRFRDHPRPRIEHLDVDVDLYPRSWRAEVAGSYSLRNSTREPLPELHLSVQPRDLLLSVGMGEPYRMLPVESDESLGFHRYRVDPPLGPGETARFTFSVVRQTPALPLDGSVLGVLENGTLLGDDVLPVLGYDVQRELADPEERRRWNLPSRSEILDPERSFASADAGWITFDTTVTTAADQTAYGPGELVGQGHSDDGRRRWRRYRSVEAVNRALTWLSADYEVARERCPQPLSEGEPVVIEVAHLPAHRANVPRMIEAACATLAFGEPRFGDYPYSTLRIAEAPSYFQGAFALPGLIVMSESFGFQLRVLEEDDPPFQVTAHEVAHQWWGHQVVPAAGPGARLVGETISQYVSSRVLEEMRGEEAKEAFLRRQLRRYLLGRSRSAQRETPLVRVGDSSYLHSGKGAVVMNALAGLLGPEAVDRGLGRFVSTYRRGGPPFPLAEDLVRHLERSAPAERSGLVREALREIVLFDHGLGAARATRAPAGGWTVEVDGELGKLVADPDGNEREVPFQGELALRFVGSGETIAERRVEGASGPVTWRVTVPRLPDRVVLDPGLHYIDRHRADNSVAVERIERGRGGSRRGDEKGSQ